MQPNRYNSTPAKSRKTYTMNRGGQMIGNNGNNAFNSVELERPDGSWFDLTHPIAGTGRIGKLMPCLLVECYPGDKYNIKQELALRFQPMLTPAMHRFDVRIENFFVPNRILMENDKWEKFMRGDTADVVALPWLDLGITHTALGSLADYMGVPPMTGTNVVRVQALPFCGYQRVIFEYYRNQNLSAMTDNDKPYCISGDNTANVAVLNALRNRAYQHDYLTSALPFTQKGTESTISFDFTDIPVLFNDANGTTLEGTPTDAPVDNLVVAGIPAQTLFVNSSTLGANAFSINEFRLALARQHWLERMAIGGTRYTEMIKAHFGVTSSDQRLDRPEFIGGMKTPVVIGEVLQTSATVEDDTPQGNMSGHGIAASYNPDEDDYFVEEHGWIIGILSVMPKAIYAGGIPRSLDWHARNDRDEFYWPEFANLGEQAIKNREINCNATESVQDEDWGYTARFNELRFMQPRVCGQFRSNVVGSMASWTAARIFTDDNDVPNLSEEFITAAETDVQKIFVVEPSDEFPELIWHVTHHMPTFRLLPKYATPELRG